MAHYVRNVVSKAIVCVAGNTKCHLDPAAWDAHRRLHRLLNAGRDITPLDLAPNDFEDYLRGKMWTNPGREGLP